MNEEIVVQFAYIASAVCFILSLKWLSRPITARRGVKSGELGMLIAVVATMLKTEVISYEWIIFGFVVGSLIGTPLAVFMPMTAVPQRTAISHAFGALAVGLVGTAEYYHLLHEGELPAFKMGVLAIEILLGFLTFTGSLMAFGKLQELLPGRPIVFKGSNFVNLAIFGAAVAIGTYMTVNPEASQLFPFLIGLSLLFGIMLIVPIGGADMPTVISLLNAYAGLSAAMLGFVFDNKLLIVAGALDGSSGLILSIIMCRAMNRSFTNVLFGGFGQVAQAAGGPEERPVRSASPEEAASILEAATSVIIVPGYGMAVAQAQHKVRELYDSLAGRGVDVKFAIHPVAGRMPGHMNVLLAEAEIPYDKLVDMEDINGEFPQADVALVIGANDVTNPAARTDKTSPIFGMPILDTDKARTVMVIKRGMSPGFAGVENELYFQEKTMMLFGDAKSFVGDLVKEMAGTSAHAA